VPGVPLDRQRREDLLNLRSIRPDGSPPKRIDDGEPWAEQWPGPELLLLGHDAAPGPQRRPHAVRPDTRHAARRGPSALVLPERTIVSVPAARAYAPTGGAP